MKKKNDRNEELQQNEELQAADANSTDELPGEEVAEAEGKGSSQEERDPLKQEIDELNAQLQQKHDELLRKQADFDNYRRISRREKDEAREYALEEFLEKMLPVVDNLERATKAACQEEVPPSYIEGLEMIYKQLLQLLEREGVTVMETVGQPFDPHYHHAVMQAEEGEGAPGTVVDELQKGYIYKKKVLRPAMVKVC